MIPIDNLIDEIKIAAGLNVILGMKTFGPDEYPLINILPDVDMNFNTLTTTSLTLFINLTIKIITAKDCERQAFDALEATLKTINKIDCQKGNRIGTRTDNIITGSISTLYTDNTYEISIPYTMQEIIQNTI